MKYRFLNFIFGFAFLPLPGLIFGLGTAEAQGTAPSITAQPTNILAQAGEDHTLSVGASGSGPLNYQWYFNGSPLPSGTEALESGSLIFTIAGSFDHGSDSGDGFMATNASLTQPGGVAVDGVGNLYIADTFNQCIRKVDLNGIITRVAGGVYNFGLGDGGWATNATLSYPYGVAAGRTGILYIADTLHDRIRKVDANGIISTVAGNGTNGFAGDGGEATNAELSLPVDLTVDGSGNLFVVDGGNNRIREVSTNGVITTVAGDGTVGFAGDGGLAINAELNNPIGLAMDSDSNLYIADKFNNRIRKVDANGVITTYAGNGIQGFAGEGGAATNAELNNPYGVALDGKGDLLISDTGNQRIRKIDMNGIITTVAGNGTQGFLGDGGVATNSEVDLPFGLAADGAGNLFVADTFNDRIRKLTATGGSLLTLTNAGSVNAGNYWVILANPYGIIKSSVVSMDVVYPPTSNLVTAAGSQINISAEAFGDQPLFYQWYFNGMPISSGSGTAGPEGLVFTIAGGGVGGLGDLSAATNAELNGPNGVAVDGAGNLFIADTYNNRIRKVDTNGIITTVAGNGTNAFSGDGGPANDAELGHPSGVSVDSVGNLFIADSGNDRIRKVNASGIITTVAGNGTNGFNGDGGLATNAELSGNIGVVVDSFGNLFIADSGNDRVREVSTNGTIATVAGT